MTAFAEAKLAVEALQTGARDFLIKPFQPEHLVGVIARYQPAIDTVSNGGGQPIVARAPATLSVLSRCQRVATTNATVLLTGESGVGKDVFARQIHSRSPRSAKPYIAINCAAIPETLLESTCLDLSAAPSPALSSHKRASLRPPTAARFFLMRSASCPLNCRPNSCA